MRLVRILALALFVLTSAACVGCGRPLGTNDLVLSYRTEGAPPADLETLASARLAAAEITADVSATHEGIRVAVDRDSSGPVDRLLAWPGGVAVYEVVPGANVAGPHERPLSLNDGTTSRTIVARDSAAIDLHDGVASVERTADGRSLDVHLTPPALARIAREQPALAGKSIAVALSQEVLISAPAESLSGTVAALGFIVPFGDDLEAYARARATRLILVTPPLPPLTRSSAVAAPADYALAITALGLPFVLSIAWLFFVRRFDRAQPEPWWLVVATFALGGISLLPAALAEVGWARLSPWLDPSLATMGARVVALPLALPVFVVVIGLSEETAKFLGAWTLAFHRREFDEPIDGIVYGAASSLGFAAVENVKYFAIGRLGAGLVATRMFITLPAHLFFGAIWGYALGRKLIRPRTSLFAWVVLAAIAHGAFDTFLSIERLAPLAFTLNLGLATTFVVVLRRSLRHGAIAAGTRPIEASRRTLYVVGSPGGFVASVVSLHLVAGVLFVASSYAQASHWHVGWLFFTSMSSLVTMLGVSAYFLSTTMPLDAVLDDHGVTFAGASRGWSTIRAVEPSPRGVHVRSSEGDVWIGPASKAATARILSEIDAKIR